MRYRMSIPRPLPPCGENLKNWTAFLPINVVLWQTCNSKNYEFCLQTLIVMVIFEPTIPRWRLFRRQKPPFGSSKSRFHRWLDMDKIQYTVFYIIIIILLKKYMHSSIFKWVQFYELDSTIKRFPASGNPEK